MTGTARLALALLFALAAGLLAQEQPAASAPPVQITSMRLEPSTQPVASASAGGSPAFWTALREGWLNWLLIGVIVGGLAFLSGGMALKRDLDPRESACAVALGVVVALLAPLSKLASGPGPAPGAPASVAPAAAEPVAPWECAEGGFSLAMPAPRARTQAMAMALPITQYAWVSRGGGYMIGWFDVPAWMATRPTALDDACTGAVQNMGNAHGPARETSRTTIRLGAHPGREVEGTLPRDVGRFRLRAYHVGGRFYILSATGFAAWIAGPDTKRYLDSFTLARR